MQDMWLAMNRSKNWLEFALGGGPVNYTYRTDNGTATTSTSQTSQSYQAALFFSILGIQAEYEKTNHDLTLYSGAVALRLFGTSQQDTNLTIKYGIRKTVDSSLTPEQEWSNQFGEASLNLYLISVFGLSGDYRQYFPDESSNGTDLRGRSWKAGVFLDFNLLRIFGDYFEENLESSVSGVVTKKDRTGFEYGARFYF